jgi:hypothetical protein
MNRLKTELIQKELETLPENFQEEVLDFIGYLKTKIMDDTEYILSVPGMKEKILESGNTPDSECTEEPGW